MIMLFIGAFCGIACMSCLIVGSIEDEKQEAYQRGFERGKKFGAMAEKGKKYE